MQSLHSRATLGARPSCSFSTPSLVASTSAVRPSGNSACSVAPGMTPSQRIFSSASVNAPKRSRGSSTRVASAAALAMMGGGGGDFGEVSMTSQIISTAVTTGVAAVAAWFLAGREASVEQDRSNTPGACPRCEGSRYEPCVCLRWSDGADNSGCSSCNKTGYMPCRDCRGGGTAVPIKARIYVPSGQQGGGGQMRQMSSAAAATIGSMATTSTTSAAH